MPAEALTKPARRSAVRIEAEALDAQHIAVHAVSRRQRTILKLRASDDGLHPGERALWAHLLSASGEWLMCGPDKASMRCGARLGFADRIVSLQRLLDDIGCKPKARLHPQYTEKWQQRVLADFALEKIFGPPR